MEIAQTENEYNRETVCVTPSGQLILDEFMKKDFVYHEYPVIGIAEWSGGIYLNPSIPDYGSDSK